MRNASGRIVADSDSSEYDWVVGGFDYRPTAGGTFFFAVKAFDGPGSHTVAFEEDEPGGPPTPTRIEPGQTLERDFFSGDDSDTFSIQLEQGKA